MKGCSTIYKYLLTLIRLVVIICSLINNANLCQEKRGGFNRLKQ